MRSSAASLLLAAALSGCSYDAPLTTSGSPNVTPPLSADPLPSPSPVASETAPVAPVAPEPSGKPVDSRELAQRIVAAITDAGSMRMEFTSDGQVLDVDMSVAQGRSAIRMPNPVDPTSEMLIVDDMVYVGGGQGKSAWTSFPLSTRNPDVADLASFARLLAERTTDKGLTQVFTSGRVGEVSSANGLTTYDISYPLGSGERTRVIVDDQWRVQTIDMYGRPTVSIAVTGYGVVGAITPPPASQVTPLG